MCKLNAGSEPRQTQSIELLHNLSTPVCAVKGHSCDGVTKSVSSLRHVRPNVISAAPTGRIFVKFGIAELL